jgi:predicted membrane-bound mannosyltransferase
MGRVAEGRVRGWWLRFRLNSTLIPIRKCAIVVAVWLVVWVALFTSFFTHFGGLADSIRTFGPWLGQAGASSPHAHSWTFYFERLFWFRSSTGPLWTEGLLLVLGVIGARVGFRRVPQGESDAGLIRFLAFYTALLAAIYAVIPYKTPWCALGFLHGLILLAGVGAAAILRLGTSKSSRLAMAVVLTLGAAHLGWQAWRASFPMCADRGNPWVYAHTSPDLLNLVADVVSVAQAGQGGDTVVEVIAADGDYWPLPWYLRTFNRVGWWAQMPETALAPVVIASSGWSPEIESRQTHVMAGYFQLRPQVFLELHVERGLWEKYLKR